MKTAKTIWNIVTWTIVVLAVVIAILLAGVRLVGIDPYTVLSGSMEPEYHVGSIIYVVDVDPHELKKGDPVTYMLSDSVVVTHRIEEIVPAVDEMGAPIINDRTGKQAIRFVTKGDGTTPSMVRFCMRTTLSASPSSRFLISDTLPITYRTPQERISQ